MRIPIHNNFFGVDMGNEEEWLEKDDDIICE
jgi:hypothetical protein